MTENPKAALAAKQKKPRMQDIPIGVLIGDAAAHALGADKYGRLNWRESGVLASTYLGAMLRHITAWAEGEQVDPESGVHHLYHVRACCAVVLDAMNHGRCTDDLQYTALKIKEPEQ